MRQKEAQYVGISTNGPSTKMAVPAFPVRLTAAAYAVFRQHQQQETLTGLVRCWQQRSNKDWTQKASASANPQQGAVNRPSALFYSL